MVILLELTHTMTRILDLPRLTTAYVARTFMNTSVISWFCPQNELSDHCKIVTVFKLIALNNNLDNDNYNWIKLNDKYTWDQKHGSKFAKYLENFSQSLYEIKQRIEHAYFIHCVIPGLVCR